MIITIKNNQKKHKLDIRFIKRVATKIVRASRHSSFDLGIWFTTDKVIQRYNKKYRNKDRPTDILSFPFHHEIPNEKVFEAKSRDERYLGDLIISVEQVEKQAQELNQTFNERLITLLIHGVCHLEGYTHNKKEEYDAMQQREDLIRTRIEEMK